MTNNEVNPTVDDESSAAVLSALMGRIEKIRPILLANAQEGEQNRKYGY